MSDLAAHTQRWRPWTDIEDLFDGRVDIAWADDRDLLDRDLADPWQRDE